ncbi:hypothetical protein G7009_27010 [Pseudomonas capeferrum]|uniref:hypothetical protein n=1 Tax=Pseudomonas capeferrum TaxID=1495066 RepID=UPI0015E2C4E3|nr:hypothetical protein [Pseudomonas capeferrum]MBA1205360.1 hypothetical protein [Pseudomonas capeferrum]
MSLEQFSSLLSTSNHNFANALPVELLLSSEGGLQTFYAPFDHVNAGARIVLCGITPGLQQASRALDEARQQLQAGASIEHAKQAAKETASFAGAMRSNLVNMLDHVGVHMLLGIDSCARLFDTHRYLVHYTSALRYPVFLDGQNYSGSPSMLSRASLRHQVETHLAEEIRALGPQCLYVPLGPKVTEVFQHLQGKGLLKPEQLLDGLPHPSGANAERISYFLGGKPREQLSSKTNAATLDAAKTRILAKLAILQREGLNELNPRPLSE